MEVLYPRCAGLDVHAGSVTACARIASGTQVTYDHHTVSTTTRGLLDLAEWLTSHGWTHVAMEATGVYWKPVWHVLEEQFTLILANAMHIRNVPGRKSDMNDATWIADLLAHGLIRSSFVPPAPIQELRDLTRTRRQLVHEVARHVLRIQKTLEDANLKLTQVMSDIVGVSGRAILNALIAGETDPNRLADLTRGRLKATRADLLDALHGRVTDHHRFMIQLHLSPNRRPRDGHRHTRSTHRRRARPLSRRRQSPDDHARAERNHRSRAHRRDRHRHAPLPVGGASHLVGRLLSPSRRKRGQTPLHAYTPDCSVAQTHADQCGLGRHPQKGQLPTSPIPPHQEPARREEGHSRRRQLHADRSLFHAPRRCRIPRPWLSALRTTRQGTTRQAPPSAPP